MKNRKIKKSKWIWVLGCLFLIGFVFFYKPKEFYKIDVEDVVKISIFNGHTGDKIEISDRTTINHIISNLNSVTIQRKSWALGHMGYRYRFEIFGDETRLETYIVNSETIMRKDPYYYDVVDGEIDIEYIASLFLNE